MASNDLGNLDRKAPPFDQMTGVRRLAADRRGAAGEYARHELYIARDRRSRANVLIKLARRPGLVYQHDLMNEIETLTSINRELPDSRHFPLLLEHGRLGDGRVYLVTTLFDEFPLAMAIGPDRQASKMVGHLRTAIEIASVLIDLHRLGIFHVDLNPMNILYRVERGRPVIRIVDFESSYDVSRHAHGMSYNPPTTSGYSAPEVPASQPDARADVFSLGAVLYTMLVGYDWSWEADVRGCVEADHDLERDVRELLLTAVARAPDERYRSMQDFHDALAGYLERIWPGRSW